MKKLSFSHDPRKVMQIFGKFFAALWFLCIVIVLTIFGYVIGIRKELFDKAPSIFAFSMLGFVGLGCLSFGVAIVCIIAQLFDFSSKKQNIITYFIKLIFVLGILPAYLIGRLIMSVLQRIKKIGIARTFRSIRLRAVAYKIVPFVFILFVILPVWAGGYYVAGILIKQALGYNPDSISISGTGSMSPTFPKGEGKDPKELAKQIVGTPGMIRYPNGIVITGKRYFGYELGRGDIVSVENDRIREMTEKIHGQASGWVKRIIGMPGDSLELRDGVVYLNGEPLLEPYTAKSRSSFGESFLSECKKVTIPIGSIFVMGDNRKGSGDSREIGFIEISATNHVLPLKSQKGSLDKTWRDTSRDLDTNSKIRLNKEEYLRLLNEKRKEAGVRELKYQPKLEISALKRGEIILKYNDFSFDATRSGYTMARAMNDSGYYNTVWGEAPTQGYYEAEELIDNQFQFPDSKKFLLDKAYQEVGISEVEGEINGCPTQVVVQHYAGYVPPNYKKEDIESWKTALSRLREIQPSWASLKNNNNFYQSNKSDVDRINDIISTRISIASTVVTRMDANQWFSAAEQRMLDQDKELYDEQVIVATTLNSR